MSPPPINQHWRGWHRAAMTTSLIDSPGSVVLLTVWRQNKISETKQGSFMGGIIINAAAFLGLRIAAQIAVLRLAWMIFVTDAVAQ
jgi:hypothetical protein